MSIVDARAPATGFSRYVSLYGLGSLGLSGLLYVLYRLDASKAEQLHQVHYLESLDDVNLMDLLPMLVAVRGKVGSHHPRQCSLCDQKAVIYEFVEEDIHVKQAPGGTLVRTPEETVRETSEVEWFVDVGSTHPVKVEGGRGAELLDTAMEMKQRYEDVQNKDLMTVLKERVWQSYRQGKRSTEKFLPVGSLVTVVGELARNTLLHTLTESISGPQGAVFPYLIRKPVQGPFYITPLPLPLLRAYFMRSASWYRTFALAFGILGGTLVGGKALWGIWSSYKEWRFRQVVRQAEAKWREKVQARALSHHHMPPEASEGEGLTSADRLPGLCVVCLDKPCEVVFTRCGHLCACMECSAHLGKCPICRLSGGKIRVYQP